MHSQLTDAQDLRNMNDAKNLRTTGAGMTADELRETLDVLGLTQTDAAKRLRVSLRTVQNWCAGTHEVPGPVKVLLETWRRHPELLEEGDNG